MFKLDRKLIVTYSVIVLIVTISLFSFFFFFFRFRPNITPKYVFPNPLHVNATLSDMVVENDSSIHFISSNHDYSNRLVGPTYTHLNLKNNEINVDYLSPSSISTDLQLKIGLSQNNTPLIYLYSINSFFDDVGTLLTQKGEIWESYPAIENWPWFHSSLTRGPVLDWYIDSNDKLIIGYIYHGSSVIGDLDTPTVYNETTNTWIFLNNTFNEIQGREVYAPGDFIVFNRNIAITWTRVIDDEHSQPYLAVYWENEGWKLYSIGSSAHQSIPIALFYIDSVLNLFYYETGSNFYNGSINQVQYLNSSVYNDRKITDINGKLRFYSDSICSLNSQDYAFIYSKKIQLNKPQYDVFLGKFNGTDFYETQLTNTEDLDEYYAHCELSSNYIHYTWTQTPWNENEIINQFESIIFYNRSLIIEIERLNFNYQNNFSNCLSKVKYVIRYLDFDISKVKYLVIMYLSKKSNIAFLELKITNN